MDVLNTGYESVEQTMVDPTIYVLDKVIWDQYDMVATRAKVIDYIRLYKESRAKCIQTTVFSSVGLTSTIDPNKVFMPTRINNGGFANLSNEKIDAEEIVKYTVATIVFCVILIAFFQALNFILAYVKELFN